MIMDTSSPKVIAWLMPVTGNRWAVKATRMAENSPRRVDITHGTIDEGAGDESSCERENETVLSPLMPKSALSLSFDYKPKGIRGFVIGTDPKTCDIVLPKIRGISRRHCHITFDAEKRLVLRDTSKHGSAVWYDGHSNGDRRRSTWLLSSGLSYGFPYMVRSIVIGIQAVKFRIVVNQDVTLLDSYQALVNNFLSSVSHWHGCFPANTNSLMPAPLRARTNHIVKHTVASENGAPPQTYLWNMAKPWEPLVKAADS